MTRTDLIQRISQAIARREGYYVPGSRAARNNNPGNLRRWGNVAVDDGFAHFPSVDAGWEALRAQIAKNVRRGLTLLEFFAGKPGVYYGYAPSTDGNDPEDYAAFVAKLVGVPVSAPLDTIPTEEQ